MENAPSTDLSLAMKLHQTGEIAKAEQIYRRVLEVDGTCADAWHLLGVVALQRNHFEQAVECICRAIQLQPDAALAHCNLGVAYKSLGRYDEAVGSYRQALNLQPDYAEVHYNLGLLLKERDKPKEAASAYRQAIHFQPGHAAAHSSLGLVLRELGKLEEAESVLRRALELRPGLVEAQINLGNVLRDQQKPQEAMQAYQKALHLKPDQADAHNNLACLLREEENKTDEAIAHWREAIRLKPNYPEAHHNLGRILWERADCREDARSCFQKALECDPQYLGAHLDLGVLLASHPATLEQAEKCFRRALELDPQNALAHDGLAEVLTGQGEWALGAVSYARAQELAPSDARRLKALLAPPIIPQSSEEIDEHRHRVDRGIDELLTADPHIPAPQMVGTPDFYRAYHGANERPFREKLAQLYLKGCPNLAYTAPHCQAPRLVANGRRIKIGFASVHLRVHTIGRLNSGLIRQLDRSIFDVTLIRPEHQDDTLTRAMDASADRVLTGPNPRQIDAARKLILAQEFDVLFYPDIGMEPWSYLLGFSRLAPVQCVTWGHPITTGIPTMDYFISSEDLDQVDAQEHYTERLIRLKNLAVYYERPQLPTPAKTRAQFGLPENAHLYGCPQTLFKFHPDFDQVLADILRRDPSGVLVLLDGQRKHWNDLLLQRFRKNMPDVVARIRFLPSLAHADYLAVNALCETMLDPLHFGGGNTSFEALALGVPIVTLPSQFLRGRITLSQYRQMKMLDCIAANPQEYVELAVRLGTDKDFRNAISAKILQANGILFENDSGVRELEEFLVQAVGKACNA